MAAKSDGEFQEWLDGVMDYYSTLSDVERNYTIDMMIACSGSSQLSHLYSKTSVLLYRDFIKLLPPELKERVLSFLDSKSLLACCCVNKCWNEIISSTSRVWQQACNRSGFIVSKQLDNTDAKHWKDFFLEMTRRLNQMKTYNCFSATTYDRNLRRVTAVYYYKGKVATASDSKIIQIWDSRKDVCLLTLRTDSGIASIKFDDRILVASSFIGHMVSWDVLTGQRLTEYMRHGSTIFSFDYSKELNLVISGSADCLIKIWALSNGYLYKTLFDHSSWVLKIMLSPYPAEKGGNTHLDRHLLFSMDKSNIVVRLMNFIATDMSAEGLFITTLYSIKYGQSEDVSLSDFTPGLHFDGEFLYYTNESFDNQKSAALCKWDVRRKCLVLSLELNVKVKALLGVGKRYIVILTSWQHKTLPNFLVLDKNTLEKAAVWNLPPGIPIGPNCSQLCLGEQDWLNGLDGTNDHGVLLTAALNDNCVYVLKWIPRTNKIVT